MGISGDRILCAYQPLWQLRGLYVFYGLYAPAGNRRDPGLGILALFFSAIGGLLGGWIMYFVSKKKFNPVVGIAGVSCVPTTSKLAQHAAAEEDPFVMVLGVAMGANVCGVITSAIIAGIFVATIGMVA